MLLLAYKFHLIRVCFFLEHKVFLWLQKNGGVRKMLTLNPLYHSLIVASSYLVWDFKKSKSSLANLSLLVKQPILNNKKIDDDDH